MKTIEHFKQLKASLGLSVIPDLALSNLKVISSPKLLNLEEVKQQFDLFDPDSGWVLYRDSLRTEMVDFSRHDIIEGEWSKPGHSLRIRLVSPNQYHLTQCAEQPGEAHAYQDIKICLQPISGRKVATYRVWWHSDSKGPRQSRWEPFYQQFIGFDLGE
ncbi:hypothetical protein [Vibrio mexicanus]|uniref:hypothetical protein n=1 Tax=Vibrio mexicanus TaxID=1004326 RepID=UPI00063C3333|nr:hypothetical protein [Vibrio mexicanus]